MVRLYDLEQENLQILRLRYAPEDRMIRALTALLDLPQRHAGVLGRVEEHRAKELRGHEMRTGAGGKVSS